MAAVREIMLISAAAVIGIVIAKLAAPSIDRIPVIGPPLANLIALV